eukprot:SAG31_NODE_13926_length_837_cov_1.089431_1_plen_66_part_00
MRREMLSPGALARMEANVSLPKVTYTRRTRRCESIAKNACVQQAGVAIYARRMRMSVGNLQVYLS